MNIGSITQRSALAFAAAAALLAAGPATAQGAFPGKNGRIAFTRVLKIAVDSEPETASQVIQTASSTGRGRRTLPTCPADGCLSNSDPAWSPDGRLLAFTSVRGATLRESARGRIGLIRADGTGLRQLPRITSYDTEPAWSPDGRFFAFNGSSYGVPRAYDLIYTARAGGSQVRRVTPGTGYGDHEPAWSGNGKIAFTRNLLGTSDLYVMNPDGSAPRLLARHGRYPDWSPRGEYLAFTGPGNYIYIVRSDGSGIRRLIRGGHPAWSPDGRWIAFSRRPNLYVVRTDGSGLRRIAKGYANSAKALLYVEPSWQPRR